MIDAPPPISAQVRSARELVSHLDPPQYSIEHTTVCDGEIGYHPAFPLMLSRAVPSECRESMTPIKVPMICAMQ
jgi:hypothetical protein